MTAKQIEGGSDAGSTAALGTLEEKETKAQPRSNGFIKDESAPETREPSLTEEVTPSSLAPQAVTVRRKTRAARTFPASSFLEALPLAQAIQRYAAGQRIRRLTLFENWGKSPDSGPSRQLMTSSAQYGLTKGGYSAEYLELTDHGRLASSDESIDKTRLAARLELAITRIAPFNAIYEQFKGNRVPALSVVRDFVLEQGVHADNADECVETFIVNARDLKLIQPYAGAERLLTFDILIEELDREKQFTDDGNDEEPPVVQAPRPPLREVPRGTPEELSPARILAEASDLSSVCFFISPIGGDGTRERAHADLVLGSLVEPALDGLGLRLVRADKIGKPGMITAQVIDHVVKAPLVIADLSFGNPNVYYELALRHAFKRPAVQIIRSSDHLPFDVGQFRTVVLDMTDIYTLVPQIDSYRAEIARQCRAALDDSNLVDSPLSLFYPHFWAILMGNLKVETA